jgi:CHASE3 domain sensor protein
MDILKNARYMNSGLAAIVAALFIVTIASTVYLTKTLLDSRSLLTNSTNTVSAVLLLQDLELNIRTAESSQRGYIISGDSKYLNAYTAAVKVIPEEQKALGNKTYAIDVGERATLNNLISQRLDLLKRAIDIRSTQGIEAAITVISTNRGLEISDSIESLSKRITREKFEPFTSTYQKTQNSLRTALLVAGTMIGFVLIISLLLMKYFQRTITKERATEGVKNEFLSLASHQLRTPASNVKQYWD